MMNFNDTLKSVELVLATGEVPLVVGESGIGKTALAQKLALDNKWYLITVDGNLLKEGEIGGLPIVETYQSVDTNGERIEKKTTLYAVHTKLRAIDEAIHHNQTVLLFIDEINRCEHTVQQELMNLILNREINGYRLHRDVKIVAAMNPPSKYALDLDYQVIDMDAAQENRFVWLHMESDPLNWLLWAQEIGLEEKVIEFVSTFPEYLNHKNGEDVKATPRSYERLSKAYSLYKNQKDTISRHVFLNVVQGNIGKVLAQEFMSFIEADLVPLLTYEKIFETEELEEKVILQIKEESHTRLYIMTLQLLKKLEGREPEVIGELIERLMDVLAYYPVDLRIGMMKVIKSSYPKVYQVALENKRFVDFYFDAYSLMGK